MLSITFVNRIIVNVINVMLISPCLPKHALSKVVISNTDVEKYLYLLMIAIFWLPVANSEAREV